MPTELEWEDTEEKCSECEKGFLIKTPIADGQDDFHWVYKCPKCNYTEE